MLGAAGYRSFLVGRLHFMGVDQFHGFDERYVGDITNQYWGMNRNEIKEFHSYFNSKHCQELVGCGNSPVIDYDQQVFQKACELLSEPHDQPLFMVIGFYQPHYPYLHKEVDGEWSSSITQADLNMPPFDDYASLIQPTTLKRAQAINIAYKKMIRTIDDYVGQLFDLFVKQSSKGLFVYTSDHGDQLGKRSIYGKRALYEDAIQIPMVFYGLQAPSIIEQPISMYQLHRLIEATANDRPFSFEAEPVIVQSMLEKEGKPFLAEAVLLDRY